MTGITVSVFATISIMHLRCLQLLV